MTEAQAVREIKEQCGWELQFWPNLEILALPTAEELSRMRYLDPERYFTR